MKYIDAIEKVQKRATKTLPGLRDKSYSDRLKILNLPTLAYRRLRGDMIETYKIVNGFYDPDSSPKLPFREFSFLRGHKQMLRKDYVKKPVRSNAFSQRIVNTWNSLPDWIVSAETVNTFKNRLDNFWHNQEIKYNYKAKLTTGSKHSKFLRRRCNEEELD